MHLKADIEALEQVQHRIARYLYNNYTSCTPGCFTDLSTVVSPREASVSGTLTSASGVKCGGQKSET